VRLAEARDLDALWGPAVAMYLEEVGASPIGADGGASFRARLAQLIAAGHVYVVRDGDEVLFKAEIGSLALGICQLQGVWSAPRIRGTGVATAAVSAIIRDALERLAPRICLYHNDFNAPAAALYARCGFAPIGELATVLF
jgi:predicted GNAT family acetyltransferase